MPSKRNYFKTIHNVIFFKHYILFQFDVQLLDSYSKMSIDPNVTIFIREDQQNHVLAKQII